jgi:tRNA (guanine-N7-)-methyltransferase
MSETAKKKIEKPKKGDFRQRAHCNVLSDNRLERPDSPSHVDWALHYPQRYGKPENLAALPLNTHDHPVSYPQESFAERGARPELLDVGCGYGGLLIALGPVFSDSLLLGLEIREKVVNYVGERVRALRAEEDTHHNCSVLRTNAMKFLPNYIEKAQLTHLFFLFPDPCFKDRKHRNRIVQDGLMPLYNYVLRPGGLLYHVTDVLDLHEWMKDVCERSCFFEAVELDSLTGKDKAALEASQTRTEESMKKTREDLPVYSCVWRRKP